MTTKTAMPRPAKPKPAVPKPVALNPNPLPFPHLILDGSWDPDLLRRVVAEVPPVGDDRWRRFEDLDREMKLQGGPDMWGPATEQLIHAIGTQASHLADAFGLPPLVMRTDGGGFHVIEPTGGLQLHADFNRCGDLYRRLNLLVFLNEGWTDADGGHLLLVGRDAPGWSVLPVFNRTVIFETSDRSYHGHPEPLPGPRNRLSVAAYFYSREPPDDYVEDHSTLWL